MIKLVDLLDLDKMVYSNDVKSKHSNKINMSTQIIGEVNIPKKPFPENSSKETREELKYLIDYNNGIIDKQVSKKGDDIEKVFESYCKDNSLVYNKDYYSQILKESKKTILSLKYYYNRPRPYQLGEFYEIPDFKIHKLDTANTPSYPSGHSTQGHLMAELLGREYPSHYGEFKKLANFISESRIMARAHYPSDCKFGEVVSNYILGAISE